MKVLRVATMTVIALWVLCFVVPTMLLRIPSVQHELGKVATRELSRLLGTPVSVGSVGLERGNVLSITEVQVDDALGRRILSVDKLLGTFSWLDLLLEDEVKISTTRLFGLDMELNQDPETGKLNIQHILDHLASKQTDSTAATLSLHTILVRDASFRWLRGADSLIVVHQLSSKVDRLRIAQSRVSGTLDNLTGQTSQGIRLEQLSAQVDLHQSRLRISNLQARLPHSELSLPLLVLNTTERGMRLLDECDLRSSKIALEDFSGLSPRLAALGQYVSAALRVTRRDDKIEVADLDISVDNQVYCTIPHASVLLHERGGYMASYIPEISWGVNAAWGKQLAEALGIQDDLWLPRLTILGKIRAQSSLYHPREAMARLQTTLHTDVGQLRNRSTLTLEQGSLTMIDTSLETDEWNVEQLLRGIAPLERIALRSSLKAYCDERQGWQVEYLEAELPAIQWSGKRVEHTSVRLRQNRAGRSLYDLQLEGHDPLARGELKGSFAWASGGPRDMRLEADIRAIDLGGIGLLASPEHRLYSLVGSLALAELDLDTPQADISLERLAAWNDSDTLSLSSIRATLVREVDQVRRLQIESPWLQAHVRGHYTLSSLPQRLYEALLQRVPQLAADSARGAGFPTDVEINASIKHLPEALSRIAGLPISLEQPASLQARYQDEGRTLGLSVCGESLSYGGYTFEDWAIDLYGDSIIVSSDLVLPKGHTRYEDAHLKLSRQDNQLLLHLDLGRNEVGVSNGLVSLSALMSRGSSERSNHWGAEISLSPSKLRIHEQLWSLSPAQISVYPDSLNVRDLKMETTGRSLHVSGGLGIKSQEKLHVDLEHINLGYILSAVGVDFEMIDMDLTGRIQMGLEGGRVIASAEVHSDSLLLSQYPVGTLDAKLSWDSDDMNIYLDGTVQQAVDRSAKVLGYIRPANGAGIDLLFDADRLELGFTSVFLDAFANEISGLGGGKMRLFGKFEEGVTIAGEVDVQEGNIGIRALGTQYGFENKIRFTPTEILFDAIELHDGDRGRARLDGRISHRYFGSMLFDLNITEAQRIKVLQSSQRNGLPVYGLAYGSGNAKLRGSLDRLMLDVELKSDAGTDVTLDFTPTRAERDERLVTFKPLRPNAVDSLALAAHVPTTEDPVGAIDMRLNLEVTPVAKQTLRMGDGVGNELKGRTEGRLQINVPYVGAATVFGGLNVVEGSYVFRLEQLAHKRFTLREGGRLDFRGDPMKADINLQASYALTANIADLDENLAVEARRTNVPVHCLLKLSGELTKPDIRFGIELPGAEAELERRVRSLLHTEDAVNRQMLYLIALGKFSPREDKLDQAPGNTTSNLAAVASSAISEQLSYLLGNLTQNINIGTSIKTRNAAFEDTDIELLFSGSWFDNRLLVNGNFGYHDNPFLQNAYIGEFDIEYKLNRSGSLRLKAYNHYNNMYQYLRQSLTTQGVGVLWRQRFDSISDLFPKRRRRSSRLLLGTTTSPALPDSTKRIILPVPTGE